MSGACPVCRGRRTVDLWREGVSDEAAERAELYGGTIALDDDTGAWRGH